MTSKAFEPTLAFCIQSASADTRHAGTVHTVQSTAGTTRLAVASAASLEVNRASSPRALSRRSVSHAVPSDLLACGLLGYPDVHGKVSVDRRIVTFLKVSESKPFPPPLVSLLTPTSTYYKFQINGPLEMIFFGLAPTT